jgi:serine/threonine protein kinase
MDNWVGRELGPYHLRAVLGGGGMGMVYRAMHEALQQPRAIKILRPDLAADPDVVERFRREAMIAAGLRQQNIVLIYDVSEHENIHYMVMEMLEGVSLRDLIRSATPLPLDRVVSLLRQLADALDYAHARGVVHRDIKPGNVMVAPDDHLTLVDFGIARAAEASRLTRSGMVIGTAEYMAPEAFTGDGTSQSADLYALGIVAYELLTGKLPFTGNPTAISYAHVHNPMPALGKLRPDLPRSVEEALRRQTAKQPDERFPNARSFIDALAADTDADPPTLVGGPLPTTAYPSAGVGARSRDVTPPPVPPYESTEPGTVYSEPRPHGPPPGWPPQLETGPATARPTGPMPAPPSERKAPRSAAGRLTGYVLAVLALVIAGTLALCQNSGTLPLVSQTAATPTPPSPPASGQVGQAAPATRAATSPPATSAAGATTAPAAAAASAATTGAAAAVSTPASPPPLAATAPPPTAAAAVAPTAPPTSLPAAATTTGAPAPAPAFQDVLDEKFANYQRGGPGD